MRSKLPTRRHTTTRPPFFARALAASPSVASLALAGLLAPALLARRLGAMSWGHARRPCSQGGFSLPVSGRTIAHLRHHRPPAGPTLACGTIARACWRQATDAVARGAGDAAVSRGDGAAWDQPRDAAGVHAIAHARATCTCHMPHATRHTPHATCTACTCTRTRTRTCTCTCTCRP